MLARLLHCPHGRQRLGCAEASDGAVTRAGRGGRAGRGKQLVAPPLAPEVERRKRCLAFTLPAAGERLGAHCELAERSRRAEAAAEGENRKELCHHLDIKPSANLLLISLRFYQDDRYGLAMEFFDKIAYIAAMEPATQPDFYQLLDQQLAAPQNGELTPEANEWRREAQKRREGGSADRETEQNYRRAAETDGLGVYMASLFTDVFYEDLAEDAGGPALPPDGLYERMRVLERLYPPNRGYSLQIVRQRPRKSMRSSAT